MEYHSEKMKKIVIDGREFSLLSKKEVPYGTHKDVNDLKTEAQLAIRTDEEIAEMWKARNNGDNDEEMTQEQFVENLAKGDLRKTIIDAQKAALPQEVEAIMLSAGLTRDEVYAMPKVMVDELAEVANKELGGLLNFTKTSTSDTT